MIGKKFGNRYEIKERLGAGGMSIVYKGLDTLLNRLVTIKVLRDQYASDEDFVRRFHREAQSVASLSHINIVSIFDVGFEENMHYLVMEYVEGQNLKEHIRQRGKLPVREAVPIAMQILDALQHAHDHGVVHRDIKPHNILLTTDCRVKVTDFGIARAASDATVTYTGTLVGSVHYISPEQAKGGEIGAKSDIYAAGVVLYEMLTGQLPFTGENPIGVALKHIEQDPEPPHKIVPEIPVELSKIVCRAMAKNPEQRFGSAREMHGDLEKIIFGRGHEIDFIPAGIENDNENTAVLPGLGEKAALKSNRRLKPKSAWILLVVGILLFLGVVFAGFLASRSFFDVAEIEVPYVTGKTLEEAQSALTTAGLDYQVSHSTSKVEKGLIISQSIPAGQVVKKNRLIGLEVSDGPEMTIVPYVIGKTQREAEVEIANKGLTPAFSEEFNSEVAQGSVISQDPAAGKELPRESQVNVRVSAGVEPKYVAMPNLVKKTLDEAKQAIKDQGLKVGKVTEKDSNEYFAWQVMGQEPAEGAQILQGEVVNLTVSQGPGPMADIVRVTYEVPDDGQEHRFQVSVNDSKGIHEEYNQVQQPGDLIVEDIPFYGQGKVGLYLDGNLVYSQDVP